jgi:hypothetical protein
MLKKTISYVNYDGQKRTEDHYFHLTKVELITLQVSSEMGFAEHLQNIVKTENRKELIEIFKLLIGMSYGKRSEDGEVFEKSEEQTRRFTQTAAYEALFMELATDADAAAKFIAGVIPADLAADAQQTTRQLPPPPPSPAQ